MVHQLFSQTGSGDYARNPATRDDGLWSPKNHFAQSQKSRMPHPSISHRYDANDPIGAVETLSHSVTGGGVREDDNDPKGAAGLTFAGNLPGPQSPQRLSRMRDDPNVSDDPSEHHP